MIIFKSDMPFKFWRDFKGSYISPDLLCILAGSVCKIGLVCPLKDKHLCECFFNLNF